MDMTREEAIRQIENRWSIMDYGESEALGEALDIAIETLSADTVSRSQYQGLLNAIGKVYVEVVRCKDCKYCKDYGTHRALDCTCESIDMDIHPKDFCSRGERREP